MTKTASGYKKIFWGYILSIINVSMGFLILFPSIIGWYIMIKGFGEIEEDLPSQNRTLINSGLCILFTFSFLEGISPLISSDVQMLSMVLLFYPPVHMVVELTVFHKLFESVIIRFTEMQQVDRVDTYTIKDTRYLLISGVAVLLLTAAATSQLTGLIVIGSLAALVSKIYMLTVIASLKNEGASRTQVSSRTEVVETTS